MRKIELLKQIQASMTDPSRIGDVPALKRELSGARARPEIEIEVASSAGAEVQSWIPVAK